MPIGTVSFKRNLYENGVFVNHVIDVLGEDKTPFDKMYDFSNQNLSNPFLLICEENDMDFIFPSQESQKISMGKSN